MVVRTVGTLGILCALVLVGCGGASGDLVKGELPLSASCGTTLTAGSPYECRVPKLSGATQFSLINAPVGMVIQPASGYLHWTPDTSQRGAVTVTVMRVAGGTARRDDLTVLVSGGADPGEPAIYVSPYGDDSNAGTLDAPLASLDQAAAQAVPGTTIFLRGGSYFNAEYGTDYASRSGNNLARITSSGTASQPIVIRPFGNEYVKLISDSNGIVFKDASYWQVHNIELQGNARSLDSQTSLRLWWNTSSAANEIQGAGIVMNAAFNIVISGCLIHDFPGAGLSNNGGAYLTLEDSIVFGNAEWSTSGTHGFANSKPVTTDNTDTTSVKLSMLRNLVFGNQSSMISHVFSKGAVTLAVDEGNGLHMQNTQGAFVGRFEVRHNLMLFNGKAGLGLNTVDKGLISNNSFYKNAQAVSNSGELSLQTSNSASIDHNLFQALQMRITIKDGSGNYAGVGSNYAVATPADTSMPPSVIQVPAVFANPEGGDFRPAADVPSGYGPSATALDRFAQVSEEYALTPAPAATTVDDRYVQDLRAAIFQTWPAPGSDPNIPDNLVLVDPSTGDCYAYSDRNDYPGPPHSGAVCP